MSNEFNPKNLHLRATKIGASIFDGDVQVAFLSTDVLYRKEIATLLAAAPELVTALEAAREHVLFQCANQAGMEFEAYKKMLVRYPASKPRSIEQIDNALAKARGESK